MQAVLISENSTDLYLGETADPLLQPDEILVRVRATALNRADLLQRRGLYPPPPGASPILGLEMAGEVVALGSAVTKWQLGDQVCALLAGGGYAQLVAVSEAVALPVLPAMSFEEAAAIPEAFLTAYLGLCRLGGLQAHQQVLIHAGASGVGTAAIQLVRAYNSTPMVTVGNSKKAAFVESLGAQLAINYHEADFATRINQATNNQGANIILDCIGAAYWTANLSCLAMDGKLILIGTMGGQKVEQLMLGELLRHRWQIIGTTLRARSNAFKAELAAEFWQFAAPKFEQQQLTPVIDKVFDWSEVTTAHQYMEQNQNVGKIVLQVS
jgi:putative PIG3 family NAD(P)H quinone oxidoreductase